MHEMGNSWYHWLEFLTTPDISSKGVFKLSDALSSPPHAAFRRAVHEWTKRDILPPHNKGNWERFSLTEFVWLKLVIELKKFKFHTESLLQLRRKLMGVPDWDDHINIRRFLVFGLEEPDPVPNPENEMRVSTRSGQIKIPEGVTSKEWHEQVETFVDKCPMLTVLLAHVLARRKPITLCIYPNGEFDVQWWNNRPSTSSAARTVTEIHIAVPVSFLASELILNERVHLILPNLRILSDQEEEVFNALREEKIHRLSVRMDADTQELLLIESAKYVDTNPGMRLSEIVLSNGYESIELVTVKGKVVKAEKIVKKKLK